MSNNSGFTLIEAIIVLAVIGILAAITSITASQWLPGYRLKSAARDLFNNMQYAKSQAITENQSWTVTFSTSSPQGYTVGAGSANRTVRLSAYGSGVTFSHQAGAKEVDSASAIADDITYTGDQLEFAGNGTASATGYVYLTGSSGKTYAVGTFASGLVRFKQWNGSAWQ